MRIRVLYFILSGCVVIGCTHKSSEKKTVNFDSIQTAKQNPIPVNVPKKETGHAYDDTIKVPFRYVPQETSETDIYAVAEVMPEFPNGFKALFNFIDDNLKYPSEALKKGIQGRVFVQIVIDENGTVTQPRIVKEGAPSLNKEALRIVSIMPKWKPGTQDGVPVKVRLTIPFTFKLPNGNNVSTKDSVIKAIEE